MQIEKKILIEYFDKVLSGEKNFEVRLADWECSVGDTLVLKEWDVESKGYTGRELVKTISYILKTKDIHLFEVEAVDKFGYQIIGLKDQKSRTGVDNIGVSVSFFCHDGQGNILLQKRSQNCRDEQGTWDCGGGKMELGEDFESATLRELKEEYGCGGKIQFQFPVQNILRMNNGIQTHWISIGHIVLVDPVQVKNNEPKCIDELGWFKLDKLPTPMHSVASKRIESNKKLIGKYIK